MLINPAIFMQISVSFICTLLFFSAAGFGLRILWGWDITSGSEHQLRLERSTYLISTIVGFGFVSSMAGFIYFVQTCESISPQFVGAMCATGVLNANIYGWPVLILKMIIFFGSITWIALNYIDNQGYDYPLIKFKYGLLIALLPLFSFETIYLYLFFSALNPDLIVSCCGSMFSVSASGVAAHMSSMAPKTALQLFIASGIMMLPSWWVAMRYQFGQYLLGFVMIGIFIVNLICIVSLISPYIYEHPNHHCPFCLLKSGYYFAGFFLYLPLFSGTAAALVVTIIKPFDHMESIKSIVPALIKKLLYSSLSMMVVFYMLAMVSIVRSNLTMISWFE